MEMGNPACLFPRRVDPCGVSGFTLERRREPYRLRKRDARACALHGSVTMSIGLRGSLGCWKVEKGRKGRMCLSLIFQFKPLSLGRSKFEGRRARISEHRAAFIRFRDQADRGGVMIGREDEVAGT